MQINRTADGNRENVGTPFHPERLLGYLGLARKAGRLVIGTEAVTETVRSGQRGRKPYIVFLAADVSDNTEKRIENGCTYYRVRCITLPIETYVLGHAIGKTGCIAAVGIMDEGFARAMEKCLDGSG